jgi:predicted DNA-binding transcriptional regulator YafY
MPREIYLPRMGHILKRLERGPATFEQISMYLEDQSAILDRDFTISQRTLQREIKALSEMGFEIANERKGDNRYFLQSRPETIGNNERLLEAYEMMNMVELAQQNQQFVFFETRKSNGHENFAGLLHAIKHKKITNFTHHKFWDNSISERTVHPLALKEAKGRWYLLAVDEKDSRFKSFGLDRISNLDINKTAYRTKYNYDFKEMFIHSFGIIIEDEKDVETIRISLSFEQGQYVKNYPLHHSQKVVSESEKAVVIELQIYPTYDFVQELLSMGEMVTVLAPVSLINAMKNISESVTKKYR